MVSNVVTGRNRYIIVNAIQISIEFWLLSLKIWFLKKEDLIKNDQARLVRHKMYQTLKA